MSRLAGTRAGGDRVPDWPLNRSDLTWRESHRAKRREDRTMTTQPTELLARVGEILAGVFGDPYIATDNGGHFTCSEADAIAEALLITGQRDAALTWLKGHAEEDDGGDSHREDYADEPQASEHPQGGTVYVQDEPPVVDLSAYLTTLAGE